MPGFPPPLWFYLCRFSVEIRKTKLRSPHCISTIRSFQSLCVTLFDTVAKVNLFWILTSLNKENPSLKKRRTKSIQTKILRISHLQNAYSFKMGLNLSLGSIKESRLTFSLHSARILLLLSKLVYINCFYFSFWIYLFFLLFKLLHRSYTSSCTFLALCRQA